MKATDKQEASPRVALTEEDRRLIAALQQGLPLSSRPYAAIGARIGMSEAAVLAGIRRLQENGVIKRFGVVVRHHELGYRANAMAVWDVPDAEAARFGRLLGAFDFVTLCYCRARQAPDWPYNLYCMIHGRDRQTVLNKINELAEKCGLGGYPSQVLFSRRRFKQRGAVYQPQEPPRPALLRTRAGGK